jgi:hypothetical protein
MSYFSLDRSRLPSRLCFCRPFTYCRSRSRAAVRRRSPPSTVRIIRRRTYTPSAPCAARLPPCSTALCTAARRIPAPAAVAQPPVAPPLAVPPPAHSRTRCAAVVALPPVDTAIHRSHSPAPPQQRPYATVPAVHPVSPARHRVAASLLLPE